MGRQLAASGCRVIQVEEPTLHFIARYYPEQKEFIDFLVDAFNREVEDLDNVRAELSGDLYELEADRQQHDEPGERAEVPIDFAE